MDRIGKARMQVDRLRAIWFLGALLLSLGLPSCQGGEEALRFWIYEDGAVVDTQSWLMWGKMEATLMTWNEAETHCRRLDLVGHRDWRLPTVEELRTLHMTAFGGEQEWYIKPAYVLPDDLAEPPEAGVWTNGSTTRGCGADHCRMTFEYTQEGGDYPKEGTQKAYVLPVREVFDDNTARKNY
jgi:hypothetical protein